jgi:excisionase family DNA binding protein
MSIPDTLPTLLTIRAFAAQVSMTHKAIERRVAMNTLRHVRIGRCVRIPRAELTRLLDEAERSTTPTTVNP